MEMTSSGFIKFDKPKHTSTKSYLINPIHIVVVREFVSPYLTDNRAKMLHIQTTLGTEGYCVYGTVEQLNELLTSHAHENGVKV